MHYTEYLFIGLLLGLSVANDTKDLNVTTFITDVFDTRIEIRCAIQLEATILALTNVDVREINLETHAVIIKAHHTFEPLTLQWKYKCMIWKNYWVWLTLDRLYFAKLEPLLDGQGIQLEGEDGEPSNNSGIAIPEYGRAPEAIIWEGRGTGEEYLIFAGRPFDSQSIPLHLLHLPAAIEHIEALKEELLPAAWVRTVQAPIGFSQFFYLSIVLDNKYLCIVPDLLNRTVLLIDFASLLQVSDEQLIWHSVESVSQATTVKYSTLTTFGKYLVLIGGTVHIPHGTAVTPTILLTFDIEKAYMFRRALCSHSNSTGSVVACDEHEAQRVVNWQRTTLADIPYLDELASLTLIRTLPVSMNLHQEGHILFFGGYMKGQGGLQYHTTVAMLALYHTSVGRSCPSITSTAKVGTDTATIHLPIVDKVKHAESVLCGIPNPTYRLRNLLGGSTGGSSAPQQQQQQWVSTGSSPPVDEWSYVPIGYREEGETRSWGFGSLGYKELHTLHHLAHSSDRSPPLLLVPKIGVQQGEQDQDETPNKPLCQPYVVAPIGSSQWYIVMSGRHICNVAIQVIDEEKPQLSCPPSIALPAVAGSGGEDELDSLRADTLLKKLMPDINVTDNDVVGNISVLTDQLTDNKILVKVSDLHNNVAVCEITVIIKIIKPIRSTVGLPVSSPTASHKLVLAIGIGGGTVGLLGVVGLGCLIVWWSKHKRKHKGDVEFSVIPDVIPPQQITPSNI